MAESFDIYFIVIFDRFCQKFIFGGENGVYVVFSPNFEDHLILLHYLRSKVLSRLATPEAISIQGLLLYYCQVLLYL